jgi:hypothetical protein
MSTDPRPEGSVHFAESSLGREVVVGEHEVAVLCDERGVVCGGAA